MEKFLEDTPKKKKTTKVLFHGYRRLFVLVFAVALLWQTVSLLQQKLQQYHEALTQDFKVMLVVSTSTDNETLNVIGESLSANEDVVSVKLFSPADALAALQARNAALTEALVTLGRDPMPAYFEVKLTDRAINNMPLVAESLAAAYPQLSVKYSAVQAQAAFISGMLLRSVHVILVLALVLFVAFMFLVEAYPVRGVTHVKGGVVSALLAWALSFGIVVLILYPLGLLADGLADFTSEIRQIGIAVFCALWGWTLGKWQKF